MQINLFDVDMVNLNKLLIDEQNEFNHPKKKWKFSQMNSLGLKEEGLFLQKYPFEINVCLSACVCV